MSQHTIITGFSPISKIMEKKIQELTERISAIELLLIQLQKTLAQHLKKCTDK